VRSRLGECLVQAGLLDQSDLRAAIREHERSGDRLGAVLTRMRLASEEQIAETLASQLGFPYVDLSERALQPEIVRLIPRELARRAACVAIALEEEVLVVAMADPLLFSLVQELEAFSGRRIKEVIGTQTAILGAVESFYPADEASDPGDQTATARAQSRDADTGDTGSAAQHLIEHIFALAADAESVDVHVEPTEDALTVRVRNDGMLAIVSTHSSTTHEDVIARLKLMAGLDVSERLLPQAGRMRVGVETPATVRLTTLRTAYGEKAVIRPVDRRKPVRPLEELGFSSAALEALREALDAPAGLIAVSGPRGSGRTTTLAAILSELASRGRSIVAIAQDIEYAVNGATQISTDDSVGMSVAGALAAAVTQDPDVVAVDELQDHASAATITRIAAAGRTAIVVLTADDAAEAAARLLTVVDDRDALAGVAGAIVAQRLVRRLCLACRREHPLAADDLQLFQVASSGLMPSPIFEPAGCAECGFTGYRGRTGLFEVLGITANMRDLMRTGPSLHELRTMVSESGAATLADDGRGRVESGVTSLAELRRTLPMATESRSTCAQCGTVVSPDFSACPHCGTPIGGVCAHCGRALQRGWNFCPFCARAAEPALRPSRRAIMRLVRNSEPTDNL
jgi:type IV pilus assembly protein PilB